MTKPIKTFDEIESELKKRGIDPFGNNNPTSFVNVLRARLIESLESLTADIKNSIPKSFTTEITWFSPEMKLPDNEEEVLIKTTDNEMHICNYCSLNNTFLRGWKHYCKGTYVGATEIKYWAPLPSFPEVE